MGNINELIGSILSDKKFSDSKVYSDQPILFTASQMKSYTPQKYLEMRKLANTCGSYFLTDNQIFYKQAKFMEDFEDSYEYHGEFFRYFPTYQAMNNFQLRGYFSWRTDVRHGVIEKTSLSFAFVYVYELLNQIGVSSPLEGFFKLKKFAEAYSKLDTKINYYVKLWLKDYIVYYNLDKALLKDISGIGFDDAMLTLINFRQQSASTVFEALNSLSSYNFKNSRFYKAYEQDVIDTVYMVFSALYDYYDKKTKSSIYKRFFGTIFTGNYVMFASAIFCEQQKHEDCVYEINDIYKYYCKDSNWSCERFFCYTGNNREISELLKNIDFCMRQKYDFKSQLKSVKATKAVMNIINTTIDEFLKIKHKREMPEIKIDVSKLQSIRDVSLLTQSKLIVEQEQEPEEVPDIPQEEKLLTQLQSDFLSCLINGDSYSQLISSGGIMLSVLVDEINNTLFDTFEDTVIIFDADKPVLIEDYEEDVKGIIGQ